MSDTNIDNVARALALEYYRGQFYLRAGDQLWLSFYTNYIVGSEGAMQFAEFRAQENAEFFWKDWLDKACILAGDENVK